jgi:membrane protein required for beta-lactamase induction
LFKRPSLGAILLALVPFVAMCFSVPLWDRVQPTLLGIPFNLFWLILWIVITPLCMWAAYRLEAARAKKDGETR